jgi:hypothetical protein
VRTASGISRATSKPSKHLTRLTRIFHLSWPAPSSVSHPRGEPCPGNCLQASAGDALRGGQGGAGLRVLAGTGQPVLGTKIRANEDSGPSPDKELSIAANPEASEQQGALPRPQPQSPTQPTLGGRLAQRRGNSRRRAGGAGPSRPELQEPAVAATCVWGNVPHRLRTCDPVAHRRTENWAARASSTKRPNTSAFLCAMLLPSADGWR